MACQTTDTRLRDTFLQFGVCNLNGTLMAITVSCKKVTYSLIPPYEISISWGVNRLPD